MKEHQGHISSKRRKISISLTIISHTRTSRIKLKVTNLLAKLMGITEEILKMLHNRTCFNHRISSNTKVNRFPRKNQNSTMRFRLPEAVNFYKPTTNNQVILFLKWNNKKELKLQQ